MTLGLVTIEVPAEAGDVRLAIDVASKVDGDVNLLVWLSMAALDMLAVAVDLGKTVLLDVNSGTVMGTVVDGSLSVISPIVLTNSLGLSVLAVCKVIFRVGIGDAVPPVKLDAVEYN